MRLAALKSVLFQGMNNKEGEGSSNRASAGNTTSRYGQVSPMSIGEKDIPMFQYSGCRRMPCK